MMAHQKVSTGDLNQYPSSSSLSLFIPSAKHKLPEACDASK